MDIFPVDWNGVDVDGKYEIQMYGKTVEGKSVCSRITFFPYFFVELTHGWSTARHKLFLSECVQSLGAMQMYSTLVERISLWGFTNGTKRTFAQLAFPTLALQRKARRIVQQQRKMQTYEGSMDPVLRFFHICGIVPMDWVHVGAFTFPQARISRADIEIATTFRSVSKSLPKACTPPLILASWDIETYSPTGDFPLAENEDDLIISIGTTFQRYGESEPYLKTAIILGTCDDIEGVEVISVAEESDVFNEWVDLVHREKADILIGYNTDMYDLRYCHGRAMMNVCDSGESEFNLDMLGRALKGGGEVIEKELSSAAFGDNKFFQLKATGWAWLDLYQVLKKEYKLDSYSLNNVSKHFLQASKVDLPAGIMFAKYKESASGRAEVARYCVQDTVLPLQLAYKLATLQTMFEMANAVTVPLEFLIHRGQQIRVFSVILRKARELGFLSPDLEKGAAGEAYTGATVLEPLRGAYLDDPISCLDFASLYPSIMRAHSLCYSTLVMNPKYDNIEGINYYTCVVGETFYKFAQNVPSILPPLLAELAEFRARAKRDMAEAKKQGKSFEAAIYNGRQAAFKVVMNSLYGFTGAARGFLPCQPIAATVTATGRAMIDKTASLVTELYPGAVVVYGDSVADYTPIYIRQNGGVSITTFGDFALDKEWFVRDDGKETALCSDTEIWSDGGWTRLECIIRHPLGGKDMVRVLTHIGLVDCTTDHSLLRPNGEAVTPAEVGVGTLLMHALLPRFTVPPGSKVLRDINKARTMGYAYSEYGLPVPMEILAADEEVRSSFWEAFWDYGNTRYTTDSHEFAASIFALGTSLCIDVHLTSHETYPDLIDIYVSHFLDMPDSLCAIKSLQKIAYDGMVYDATTSNHHFAAGPGRMIVHNTDSVMVNFCPALPPENKHDIAAHFEIAKAAADAVTAQFPKPIELEMEKTFFPFVLYKKKRYCGLMYEYGQPSVAAKLDIKGLQVVRRDNCPLVREVSTDILNALMYKRDAKLAIQTSRTHILDILKGKKGVEKFVVTKALRSGYKQPNQPHVHVALKILGRRNYPVASGERVPYVFCVDPQNPDAKQWEKAEDPVFASNNNLALDSLYYIEHQLTNPITSLLEAVVDDPLKEVFDFPEIASLLSKLRVTRTEDIKVAKRIRRNIASKQPEITLFFSKPKPN